MARKTLSQLRTAVDPWRRDLSDDEIEGFANLILMRLDKDFGLKVRKTFTTTAPDTSPTVTVNQGDTAVTVASGTFPTTYDGQIIQIEGSDAWYEISDTVADTSFTISSGFEGVDIIAATVEIGFHRIVLPSNLIFIEDIARPGKTPLGRLDDEMPVVGASNLQTAEPVSYYEVEPLNTSDDPEIILVDPPDAVYTYVVTGRTRITRFSGTASQCGLQEKNEGALITGVTWAAVSQSKGIEEAAFWWSWFNAFRAEALAAKTAKYGGGVQSASRRDVLVVRHPETFLDAT